MSCTVSYPFKEEKSAPFKKMETAKWKEIIPILKARRITQHRNATQEDALKYAKHHSGLEQPHKQQVDKNGLSELRAGHLAVEPCLVGTLQQLHKERTGLLT